MVLNNKTSCDHTTPQSVSNWWLIISDSVVNTIS